MPSKNAARILKAFKNFNLFFLKNIRFPSLKKEEDIVISIRIGTNGYREGLGTQYGKEHLEQLFLRKDPITILYVRSHLRLVVDLQKNVKAMQSPGYAHRVKISNLQEMANTIIYVQEHGYNTQIELKNAFSESQKQLDQATDQLMKMNADLKTSTVRSITPDNIFHRKQSIPNF